MTGEGFIFHHETRGRLAFFLLTYHVATFCPPNSPGVMGLICALLPPFFALLQTGKHVRTTCLHVCACTSLSQAPPLLYVVVAAKIRSVRRIFACIKKGFVSPPLISHRICKPSLLRTVLGDFLLLLKLPVLWQGFSAPCPASAFSIFSRGWGKRRVTLSRFLEKRSIKADVYC